MDAYRPNLHQNPRRGPTTAEISVATLRRISREELAQRMLEQPGDPSLAVIDVRDSDYIGGHIRGGKYVPTPSLDYRLPELVRTLQDKEIVVFHCALSQQRGPTAALRYLRERERLALNKTLVEPPRKLVEDEVKQDPKSSSKDLIQQVYVLDGGFVKWQEKYGEDERLTEGYEKDIWEFAGY